MNLIYQFGTNFSALAAQGTRTAAGGSPYPGGRFSLAKRTEFALTPRGRNARRVARRARKRSLWDNSAAQLFNTLYRLSSANKAADKRYLAGSEISPLQSKTTVKATVVCIEFSNYTLKRNRTTSPSCITYSLPSERTKPFSRAAASEPSSIRSL